MKIMCITQKVITKYLANDKADEVIDELFKSLPKLDLKHQWELVILSLIVLIYCTINVIK